MPATDTTEAKPSARKRALLASTAELTPPKRHPPRPAPLPDALAYSIPEVCRITGIGRTKLYELMATGKLKKTRALGRVLIVGDSLRALLSN